MKLSYILLTLVVVLALACFTAGVPGVTAQSPTSPTVLFADEDDSNDAEEAFDEAEEGEEDEEDCEEDEEGEEDEEEGDEEEFASERFEEHERELHIHHMHLEVAKAELEASFGKMEMVARVTKIAENDVATAIFAIMHVSDVMEEEGAISFLENARGEVKNPAVASVIRIKLAELYAGADRMDDVRSQLHQLILGK